jgi:TolA-binding protein
MRIEEDAACGLADGGDSMQRRFKLLAAVVVFVATAVPTDSALTAPNAAQRRELSGIRRELAKVPGLLRRRMGDEARKTVEAAEARLKRLIDAAPALKRDRSVLFIKRLLDVEKLRVRKAVGNVPAKTPVANAPASPRRKVKIPVGGKSPFEMHFEAARKAERERWERDLGYWTKKASATPQAGERERALFHVGLANLGLKRWKGARSAFETLVKEFPKGAWAVPARCRLVDLKLEQALDLPAAEAEVKALQPWMETTQRVYFLPLKKEDIKPPSKLARPARPGAFGPPVPPFKIDEKKVKADRDVIQKRSAKTAETPKTAKPSSGRPPAVPSFAQEPFTGLEKLAAVYRRAALLEFIKGRRAYAKVFLVKARALHGPPAGRQDPDDVIEQHMLGSLSSAHTGFTPLNLWKSRKPVFPYICLADLLLLSGDRERARDCATKLLAGKPHQFTELQQSYLHALRGRSLNGMMAGKERRKAAADFLAAVKLAPKSKWADRCLFLAANARWNHEHDAKAAIALWRRLMKDYPQSREWDRAAYYVGVIYQQEKRYADAKGAYESLLKEKPKTSFAKLTKEQLKKVDRELARGGGR